MILAYQNKKKIQALAQGTGAVWANLEQIQNNTNWPMILSGITMLAPIHQAQKHGLDYYYVDTGYLGNVKRKLYLRLCKNSIHANGPILPRPDDRLCTLNFDTTTISRGRKILLVPPDGKQCLHFQIPNPEHWIEQTLTQISQHTDRPVTVRNRPQSRTDRLTAETFLQALQDDIHAVVTFISNCAVESMLHDIPVVCLGPGATQQVSADITQLDNVPQIQEDKKQAWLRHLSYSQFTEQEMKSGLAWATVNMA
jgi:hypothetical protein